MCVASNDPDEQNSMVESISESLSTSIDLKSGIVVTHVNHSPNQPISIEKYKELSSIDANILQGLTDIPFFHLEKIEEFIKAGEHQNAADYLDENSQVIYFLNKNHKNFLDILMQIDLQVVKSDKKFDFLNLLVAVASGTKQYGKIETITDILLKDYSKQLEEKSIQLLIAVLTIKGNSAFDNKKYETAGIYYQRALSYEEIDSESKAWLLRNLSFFPEISPDRRRELIEQSIDCFLVAGQREQAIFSYIRIANELEYHNPEKALESLDMALSLMQSLDKVDQEKKAQLHQYKARYLSQVNRIKEAYEEIKMCLEIRSKFLGQSREKASALYLAGVLAAKVDPENLDNLENEFNYYEELANTEEIPIYYKIATWMETDEVENNDLEKEVLKSKDFKAVFGFFQAKASKQSDFLLKIEYLDKAKEALGYIEEDKELWTIISMNYAETYLESKNNAKAIYWYRKALEINPYIKIARQNLAALLKQENDWDGLKAHLEDQIKLFGQKPITCFMYGFTLLKLGDAKNALAFLMKAKNEKADLDIEELKSEALNLIANSTDVPSEIVLLPTKNQNDFEVNSVVTTSDIMKCLQDFSHSVSDRRMQFWKREDDSYKWRTRPEEAGKELFINFLVSRFGADVVVIDEVKAGAGRIDILLLFSRTLKIIIELKMCGFGYSESYALAGIEQLYHYMQSKSVSLGYLVVFDGRIRDNKKNLSDTISSGPFTIFPIGIDVRPSVKLKP